MNSNALVAAIEKNTKAQKEAAAATLIASKNVLTVKQAAIYSGVSPDVLYAAMQKNELNSTVHSSRLRFLDKADLNNWMMGRNRI